MPCLDAPAIYCQMPNNPTYQYGICVRKAIDGSNLNGNPAVMNALLVPPFFRPPFDKVAEKSICKIVVEKETRSNVDAEIYYKFGDQCIGTSIRSFSKCNTLE